MYLQSGEIAPTVHAGGSIAGHRGPVPLRLEHTTVQIPRQSIRMILANGGRLVSKFETQRPSLEHSGAGRVYREWSMTSFSRGDRENREGGT